jgi:sirohydrochlorin ferrochelatase
MQAVRPWRSCGEIGVSRSDSTKTAVVLIAHGSRQPEANEDSFYLAAELRRRGQYGMVQAAFLELAEPDIDSAAAACVARGAEHIILLPCFLSAGVHVRRDLTDAQRRLTARFPDVQFRLADPIGRHPRLVEILEERANEAGDG